MFQHLHILTSLVWLRLHCMMTWVSRLSNVSLFHHGFTSTFSFALLSVYSHFLYHWFVFPQYFLNVRCSKRRYWYGKFILSFWMGEKSSCHEGWDLERRWFQWSELDVDCQKLGTAQIWKIPNSHSLPEILILISSKLTVPALLIHIFLCVCQLSPGRNQLSRLGGRNKVIIYVLTKT